MKTGISGCIAIVISPRINLIPILVYFTFRLLSFSEAFAYLLSFYSFRCPVDFRTRTRDFGLRTHRTRHDLFPDAPDKLQDIYDSSYDVSDML